jgi:hypothetical protein
VNEWKEERAKKIAKENEAVIEGLRPKDKKNRLHTRTKVEIINAYNVQKSTQGWTFYNENDIVQRTLENRFNFLLVAYTLFLTAYFLTVNDIEKTVILAIGFVLISFLSLGIRRTTNRFNITLDIVHSLEQNDVAPTIHDENLSRFPKSLSFRKNSIIGKVIPVIMLITLGGGIAFHIVKFILQGLKIIGNAPMPDTEIG